VAQLPPDAATSYQGPLLAYRDGILELDGQSLADLAERRGTPLFVASERRVLASYEAVRAGLASAGPAELRYCAKTNNEAGILGALAAAGSSLLASHLGEVELALACGFPAERIALQRPLATVAELTAALSLGVTRLHATLPADVPRLVAASRASGRTAGVVLRLRLPGRTPLSPIGALQRRLGLTGDEAVAAARELGAAGMRCAGVNVYIGTQRARAAEFSRAVDAAFAILARLRDETGTAAEEIDLGGGLPSPTQRRVGLRDLWWRWRDLWPERPAGPSPEPFARALAGLCAAAAARHAVPLPRLVLEPGRALVGGAVVLLARVEADAGRWLFLDASRNHLGESPLLFARRLLPVKEPTAGALRRVHLAGTTLNTTDVLDLHRRLPPLEAGDLLAFCDAGAYTLARASRYAGLSPAMVLVGSDGVVRPIRRAENWRDLSSAMVLPTAGPTAGRTEGRE
jgi:diaminopimelate decarboxylase